MREFLKIKSLPLDAQIISQCQVCPTMVPPDVALGQFRYCIEHQKLNTEEYAALRNFLCDIISERKVKELEVLYG